MGLFFADDEKHIEGVRAVGFPRYRQLLEHNFKEFFLVGFIALALLIPYGLGMAYALLSKSILVMLLSGIAGGAVAGPGIACMYDLILRRLRDDRSDWWFCFKKVPGAELEGLHSPWDRPVRFSGLTDFQLRHDVVGAKATFLWQSGAVGGLFPGGAVRVVAPGGAF